MKRALSIELGLTLTAVLAGSLAAAEEHGYRQHGKHVHGVGQLNVALEGNELHIELISPAVNIVGFEHPPRQRQEAEAVQQAIQTLKDGQRIFSPAAEARCRLATAEVETDLLDGKHSHGGEAPHLDDQEPSRTGPASEEYEEHEHEHEHETGAAGLTPDQDEHPESTEHAHTEFRAAYQFTCEQTQPLRYMDVNLFTLFPATQRLEVQLISERGQQAAELTPSVTRVAF